MDSAHTQTLYIPFASPPTPSPSPGPPESSSLSSPLLAISTPSVERRRYLTAFLRTCSPAELLYISQIISPLLKRDFLAALPTELALHILGFVDEPKTLTRVACVSRTWRALAYEENLWRGMCLFYDFGGGLGTDRYGEDPLEELEPFADIPMDPALEWLVARKRQLFKDSPSLKQPRFSYRQHFKQSFVTVTNWRHGGRLLRSHLLPVHSSPAFPNIPQSYNVYITHQNQVVSQDNGVVTSLALDEDWVVVGLANSRIHIFSARTGVLSRTLIGHEAGVWGVCLVSKSTKGKERSLEESFEGIKVNGRSRRPARPTDDIPGLHHTLSPAMRIAVGLKPEVGEDDEEDGAIPYPYMESTTYVPEKQSSPTSASDGWGQPGALVVSGGCDKVIKVWDVQTGHNIFTMSGHASTIRCMRTLHGRPIAVSGSRDTTVRIWDVQRGRLLRTLQGHQGSVRCIDVNGRRAVSGSYDHTCRIWDIDTGECLHILVGHYHQVYSIAFDGVRIASGGLDTTVRVWDGSNGNCLALLQGHTALVCQLHLSRDLQLLATGGSDGRVITFSLSTDEDDEESEEDLISFNTSPQVPDQQNLFPESEDSAATAASSSASSTSPTDTSNSITSFTTAPTRSRKRNSTRTRRIAYEPIHRIAAHDSSVTALQFDSRFLVTSGADGRARLWETQTGKYVRELTDGGETVWKLGFTVPTAGPSVGGVSPMCAIMGKRGSKTVLEIWGFSPEESEEKAGKRGAVKR